MEECTNIGVNSVILTLSVLIALATVLFVSVVSLRKFLNWMYKVNAAIKSLDIKPEDEFDAQLSSLISGCSRYTVGNNPENLKLIVANMRQRLERLEEIELLSKTKKGKSK